MLREHVAPTGLGSCGLAMAINIALLTELSRACSNRKVLNCMAAHSGLRRGEGQLFPALGKCSAITDFSWRGNWRFMESLQQSDAHWDHEPKATASWSHSKRFASLWNVETARQRLECVELAPAFWVRFMGSHHLQQSDAHWDHEPSWKSHRFKAFMD